MKKTFALLLSAAATCAAYAQSSVTIYGLLDLSVGQSNTGSGTTLPSGTVATPAGFSNKRMDSGLGLGSRLGFRGVDDLGGGLRANFLLEMGINASTGGLNQGGLAWGRQVFVGLGGQGWSISAGRQYTPMNAAIATSEPLAGGYWGNVTANALSAYESIGSTPGNGTFQLAARADNSVLLSATSGGLTGNLMVAAGNQNSRGTGRFVNAGVTYSSGPLRATAQVVRMRQNTEQILATASPEWLSQWMLGGSYDLGAAKLFAGYFEFKGPKNKANLSPVATLGAVGAGAQAFAWDKNRIAWIGARVPLGNGALLAQVARETYPYTGAATGKSTNFGVTYEYALSKRTVPYVSYGQITNDSRSRSPLYGAIPQVGPNGFGADPKALSVGMRHSF